MAMPRTPFHASDDLEEVEAEGGTVDASLLPPG